MSNTRMFNILRAMDAFAHSTPDERRADPTPDNAGSLQQRAELAVALVMRFAPVRRPGQTLAETFVAGLDAEIAALRMQMRDADGRVCCCVCGTPHDDAQWASWYPDPLCMPEPEDLICAACAFGSGGEEA